MSTTNHYDLFFQFIETWLPSGFKNIDRETPLLMRLEKVMEDSRQFFFVADLIQVKILFTSRRSIDMLGIQPEDVDPAIFFTSTHQDDLKRHNLARTKLFNLGQELFIEHTGHKIISTNFRFRHAMGHYTNMLVQCYLFYTEIPYKTVVLIQVVSDISWFRKIKYGYHFYVGTDLSFFRYPDENLLLHGNIFSDREFEILKLVSSGFNSEQIAQKLFLSVHTINTHRRNILKKTNKVQISDLIYDLRDRGML